jgi:hypothetical protein
MEHTKLDELTKKASAKLHEPVYDTESLNRWKTQMFTLVSAIAELKFPSSIPVSQGNSSLDPVDWPAARCVAHQMLDLSLDHIQYVRDRPIWRPIPDDIRAALEDEPLPEQGQPLSDVCCDVLNYVLPYPRGNGPVKKCRDQLDNMVQMLVNHLYVRFVTQESTIFRTKTNIIYCSNQVRILIIRKILYRCF